MFQACRQRIGTWKGRRRLEWSLFVVGPQIVGEGYEEKAACAAREWKQIRSSNLWLVVEGELDGGQAGLSAAREGEGRGREGEGQGENWGRCASRTASRMGKAPPGRRRCRSAAAAKQLADVESLKLQRQLQGVSSEHGAELDGWADRRHSGEVSGVQGAGCWCWCWVRCSCWNLQSRTGQVIRRQVSRWRFWVRADIDLNKSRSVVR